jgi:hypothetical protein
MANTYVAIATVTVGSGGASTIEFASIPQTYTDLKLVYSTRDNRGGSQNGINISLNSSTANFSAIEIQGDGSSVASFSITRFVGYSNASGSTANTFSNNELYFPNYTSSNNKSFSVDAVQENNQTAAYTFMGAHLWSNSAAISTITLTPDTASFVQYSTATLYGIKNS